MRCWRARSQNSLIALVLLAGCTRPHDYADRYRETRQLINEGDYERAAAMARDEGGRARVAKSAEWVAAFNIASAEVMASHGAKYADAARMLESIRPPDSRIDLKIYRNTTLAMALCGSADPDRQGAFNLPHELLDEAARWAPSVSAEARTSVELRRASCLIAQRDETAAAAAYERLSRFTHENGLKRQESSALLMLSFLNFNGRHYEECIAFGKQSLQVAREIQSDYLTVKGLGNVALCYSQLGDFEAALGYFKQAETLAPAKRFWEDFQILLTNAGNRYYRLHDYAAAADHYRRALDFARRLEDRVSTGLLLGNLSAAVLAQGDVAAAERLCNEALEAERSVDDPESLARARLLVARIALEKNDLAGSVADFSALAAAPKAPEDVVWEAHAGLADAYSKQGAKQKARDEFRAAIGVIERSRNALKLDDSQITYFSAVEDIYDRYIGFLASEATPAEAFAAADASRAATLAQRAEQPNREASRTADPRAIARAMHAVLLSYWLAPAESYLWVATPERVVQFRLPGAHEISRRVEAYQTAIEQQRDPLAGDASAGRGLWDLLIGPAAGLIPKASRVIVMPDGALHRLNFETLVASGPEPHYWIQDVEMVLAPSAGILRKAGAPAANSLLALGAPASASPDFPPLPNARAELDGIASLFPKATVLTGAAATPIAYTNAHPGRYRLIHFATHATVNRIAPLDSAVICARGGGDYRLYARDVLKLPITADLVTISACNSAGARAYAGEGLVGFAWAFLRAGAHNVIAGLWRVDDASTSELMLGLYRGLQQGQSPAEALRAAKLALIQGGRRFARPYYWAPFQLYTREL